ncbi:MAG: hypothetical protein QME79_12195 [Bacillota bacterium]|nr:hypothetical protein [Bacillota bacterium]
METASQFIFRALERNPTVIAEATGKVIKYHLPEFHDVPDERCWLCAGLTRGRGLFTSERITEMFSDVNKALWPESRSLCMGCAGLQAQRPLRLYSILATEEGLRHPARSAWAEILTSPPEPPWTACLAVSGQKHLFFKTTVNRQNRRVAVQMEDLTIEFSPQDLNSLLAAVERLYTVFAKEEILRGTYSSARILQYGVDEWENDEGIVRGYRGGRLIELAVWIARRDEEAREARLSRARERKAARVAALGPPHQPEPIGTGQVGQMSLFWKGEEQ